ncbi:MAG: hypothetical protein ACP5QD_03070 [Candidatus Ratteibacteria bacterium]
MKYIHLLQQTLLYDDAYIPYIKQQMPKLTQLARMDASRGNPEPLRDGINRPVGEQTHNWHCQERDWVSYTFSRETLVKKVTLILDSGLNKLIAMSHLQKDNQLVTLPDTMPRKFRIDIKQHGNWKLLYRIKNNNQRLFKCEIKQKVSAIRFVLEKTYGAKISCVYAFYCE